MMCSYARTRQEPAGRAIGAVSQQMAAVATCRLDSKERRCFRATALPPILRSWQDRPRTLLVWFRPASFEAPTIRTRRQAASQEAECCAAGCSVLPPQTLRHYSVRLKLLADF